MSGVCWMSDIRYYGIVSENGIQTMRRVDVRWYHPRILFLAGLMLVV